VGVTFYFTVPRAGLELLKKNKLKKNPKLKKTLMFSSGLLRQSVTKLLWGYFVLFPEELLVFSS